MVHEFFSFSFRAPTARLLSSKRYAKAGMAAATDKMAHSFSASADRKGRTGPLWQFLHGKTLKRFLRNNGDTFSKHPPLFAETMVTF